MLRGGYGLFYDKTHFELITAAITGGVYSDSFTATFPSNAADPGPSKGQLPTNPFLVNGPVVNRDLLNQLYPAGSRLRNTGTVRLDNPDRVIPSTQQFSVGAERQLRPDLAVSVDYIHGMARDQFMLLDLNPGVRTGTGRTDPIVRVDPAFVQSVFTPQNVGELDYDSLEFQVQKRFSHNFSVRMAYTLSRANGNTSGNGSPSSSLQYLDDMRLSANEGPTDFDRRHNLVVSGSVLIPRTGGLNLSWVARILSGLPFTVQNTNFDTDRNGILFDPEPEGDYAGTGADAWSTHNDGGRNGARGPGFFQLDMRFGYRVRMPRGGTLDMFGEVFNLTNRANFDNPSGDKRSTNFLMLTALRAGGIPRTAQFGVRYGF